MRLTVFVVFIFISLMARYFKHFFKYVLHNCTLFDKSSLSVCVFMGMCVCTCEEVVTCGSQTLLLGIFLSQSSLSLESFINLEFGNLATLDSELPEYTSLYLLSTGIINTCSHA